MYKLTLLDCEKRMNHVDKLARRSTCLQLKTGVLLVSPRDRYGFVVGYGFNTSPEGQPTCKECRCILLNGYCIRPVYAELAALYCASLNKCVPVSEGYCFSNWFPCITAFNILYKAGIRTFVYKYRPELCGSSPETMNLKELRGDFQKELDALHKLAALYDDVNIIRYVEYGRRRFISEVEAKPFVCQSVAERLL